MDKKFETRTIAYFLIMMVGIILNTYLTHSITIVWLVNLMGFFLCYFPFLRYWNRIVLFLSILFWFFSLLTLYLNQEFLTTDLKTLGTNANILIFPLMLQLAVTAPKLHRNNIQVIFSCISRLGTAAFLVSWISGFHDILSVFHGMNAYQASIAGLFYSKNIYGAFVSLSMVTDLYLMETDKSKKRIFLILLKGVAVLLSFSRASMLQCAVMVFVYILFKKKYSWKEYILLFLLFFLSIFVIMKITSNAQWINFMTNSIFRVNAGDAGRTFLRKEAMAKFGNDPLRILFGVGFAGMSQLNMDIDNTYLYLLFTGGIYKIFFFTGVMIFSLWQILRIKRSSPVLFALCFATYLSYMIFAFFESVTILELGILNYLFMLFLLILPGSYEEVSF